MENAGPDGPQIRGLQNRPQAPRALYHYTASFAALARRALTVFRAGLALNIIASPVKKTARRPTPPSKSCRLTMPEECGVWMRAPWDEAGSATAAFASDHAQDRRERRARGPSFPDGTVTTIAAALMDRIQAVVSLAESRSGFYGPERVS